MVNTLSQRNENTAQCLMLMQTHSERLHSVYAFLAQQNVHLTSINSVFTLLVGFFCNFVAFIRMKTTAHIFSLLSRILLLFCFSRIFCIATLCVRCFFLPLLFRCSFISCSSHVSQHFQLKAILQIIAYVLRIC